MIDLFIGTGEMSGDLHAAKLIEELLKISPDLKIGGVCGPRMRQLNIIEFFKMENLRVMGFIDVFLALPKIIKQFFSIRDQILKLSPKAVLFVDYPGFHLRMEKSLRKKGYAGKLIHFICPSVWAWGGKRIPFMAKYLDLLLTIFPFEKKYFNQTKLPIHYVGHPLSLNVADFKPKAKYQGKILSIFPGSRRAEIERNLPIQLKVARRLQQLDPSLKIAISMTQFPIGIQDALIVPQEDTYELMHASYLSIATSGTITLELALHGIPTIVTYAIKTLDCWIAQKIFCINLPFYCIANIVVNQLVFPELFGPNFTEENLFLRAHQLYFDEKSRNACFAQCKKVSEMLGHKQASKEAAELIFSSVDF